MRAKRFSRPDRTPLAAVRRAAILALTAAAACVAFAIAAPLSAAKSVSYEGPVALPELDFGPNQPATVKFRVALDGKKPTKVYNFSARDTYKTCPDGSIVYDPRPGTFSKQLKLDKKGRFSASVGTPGGPFAYEVAGTVAGDGTVSGTLRQALAVEDLGPTKFCDTGVLSWTATKK